MPSLIRRPLLKRWVGLLNRLWAETPGIPRRQIHRPRSDGPTLETLEDRTMLSAYMVDRLTDVGQGSGLSGDLRYCISQAASGNDSITFGVMGTIDLSRPLPTLNAALNITGPGASSLTVERNSTGAFGIFNVAAGIQGL